MGGGAWGRRVRAGSEAQAKQGTRLGGAPGGRRNPDVIPSPVPPWTPEVLSSTCCSGNTICPPQSFLDILRPGLRSSGLVSCCSQEQRPATALPALPSKETQDPKAAGLQGPAWGGVMFSTGLARWQDTETGRQGRNKSTPS